ncbi:MAG: hypothetical protein AAB433_00055 [Nitrospirota bacterium]
MPDTQSGFGRSSRRLNRLSESGLLQIAAAILCVMSLLNAASPTTSRAQGLLPGTPLFGPWNMPLPSFDPVAVGKVLANPGDYHLRQIRMTGTVRAIRTDLLTQGCGRIHELTTFTLEDGTGAIEVFDQGACGGNTSRMRASTLAVGASVDLFVQVVANSEGEQARTSIDVLVIWIQLARQ